MMRSLPGGAGRVFLWQRVNQAVYLARNIVLARYIVPADYGDFAAALNLASYVAIASALEFRTAFFSKPDLGEDATRTQWSAEVLLNTFSLLLGLGLAPLLGAEYSPEVLIAMVGLLAVGVLDAGYSTHLYLVEKRMEFPFLTALRTFVNLLGFALCLALAMAGWGWKALLVDRVAIALVTGVVLWAHTGWRPSLRLHRPSLRWYWGFVSVMFLNALWGKVLFGFDIFAITRRLGGVFTGIYNMAMKWALIPMELGAGFLAVMALSLYSKERVRGPEAVRAAYGEVTFHIVRFSTAIAVLMALFMQDLFCFAYGPEWRQGACNADAPAGIGDPRLLRPSGSYPACASPYGAMDMEGNVSEWVETTDPRWAGEAWLAGGTLWTGVYGRGCAARHAHGNGQTSTEDDGFRCCADPAR
ncbi:MAG: oligosaccharide flippase family protein [Verrucomicrobiae bacterium]|nr:oligosaccharide flippase family protein [Verrucomicrobiae bacterium]